MYISCLLTICLVFTVTLSKISNLVLLHDETFFSEIQKHELLLVLFYVPWCVQSSNFMPKYLKAAGELLAHNPPIYLARMDCTEDGFNTCKEFAITVFPHLRIYKIGVFFTEYLGPRETATLVNYMKGLITPRPKKITTNSEYLNYIKSDQTCVVLFFKKNTLLKANFFKLFNKLKDSYRFAYTESKEIGDKHGYTDRVVLVRPVDLRNEFEPNIVVHLGKSDYKELREFIFQNAHGLVGVRTKENWDEFNLPLIVAYFHVDYKMNPAKTKGLRNIMMTVAKNYSSQINFAVSNIHDFSNELKEFGLTPPLDLAVCIKDQKEQKYIFQEAYTENDLSIFVDQFLKGKLTPYRPEKDGFVTGFVKIAVSKNFEILVKDHDNFIFLYLTPCDECNKVEELFEELASKLVLEDINIIKMNLANNAVPRYFKIEDNPEFYWVSKTDRTKPLLYKGHWNVQDMLKFIAAQATEEMIAYDSDGNPKNEELEGIQGLQKKDEL